MSEMNVEQEIVLIKDRNQKVEAEKAWEVSLFRVTTVAVITYFVASVVMYVIRVEKYYLNALIPTVGYILSTQSLPLVKRAWIKRYLEKGNK